MPLPKISTPSYELVLPSSKKKIKFRPFLVKEEKILILAMESEDTQQIASAVKDVIKSCILTRGIKVDQLSTFDIEYLFLNIRGKAVGDISTISFEHECGEIIKLDIDLSKVKIVKNKKYSDLVKITDNIMIRLSPPGIDNVIGAGDKNQIDLVMEIIRDSIVEIIEGEDVFSAQDHTREELEEFLDSLNSGQFKKLQDYYESLPKMKQDIEYTCKKCGKTETETLEGLASFFASA